jgi:hypothetical protein
VNHDDGHGICHDDGGRVNNTHVIYHHESSNNRNVSDGDDETYVFSFF